MYCIILSRTSCDSVHFCPAVNRLVAFLLAILSHFVVVFTLRCVFSGSRRRQTDGLFQPGVVCVGITGNEPWRHRRVQHSRASHQSLRPTRHGYRQTLCLLQRTVNRSFVILHSCCIHVVKWRHSNLWSPYDRHFVGITCIMCGIKGKGFVILFKRS